MLGRIGVDGAPLLRRILLLKERGDPEERVLGQPELLGESRKSYTQALSQASAGF